ncbi:MAG: circularly permuted type 2 ATP-grasp protein [Ilumatobacteraceae bacterium]
MEYARHLAPHGGYDEAFDASGVMRPMWSIATHAVGSMDAAALHERQRDADRLLDAEGAGHLVHELALDRGTDRHGVTAAAKVESRPWRLDPVPFVIDAAEFAVLSNAAVQRMRLLEALLVDTAGERQLVRDGVLPPALLYSLPSFRAHTAGFAPPRWLVHYALDVVRVADGTWRVVHDLTDAPSGLGYSLLNRAVLARLLPDGLRTAGAAPISSHADRLRRALTAAAPADRPSPRAVVLSSGPAHPTYVEHSYLATRLGYHLVEGADLVMREGRLWLRALDGLEPIDVVYRRVEDALLDPLEHGHQGGGSGVPGLVWGARGGHVALANAYGSGLAEAPELRPFLGAVAERLLGDRLQLGQLAAGESLATTPVFTGDSRSALEPRAVVLRLQVLHGPDGHSVMLGGAGRVLAPGDEPEWPTAQLAKDIWVVGTTAPRPVAVMAPPQVDFGPSVPKRVADALYWLGRAAERAEVAVRAARVVGVQLDQDPMLASVADGGWALGAGALLAAARNEPVAATPELSLNVRLTGSLHGTVAVAAQQLASLVQEASSVREYLSTTTGRVLLRLARAHGQLLADGAPSDELDSVLVDLAALAGLAMESTVRGPAWRFLDLGRRIERALAVLGSVEGALGADAPPMALQPLADAVLAANESLVAYRRRYRSDVDLDAVLDLLLRDDSNPRGLAFQLDRLREHVAALAWSQGVELVQQASTAAIAEIDETVVSGRRIAIDSFVLAVRGPLLQLADAIGQHWFADPVNPTLIGGG